MAASIFCKENDRFTDCVIGCNRFTSFTRTRCPAANARLRPRAHLPDAQHGLAAQQASPRIELFAALTNPAYFFQALLVAGSISTIAMGASPSLSRIMMPPPRTTTIGSPNPA